MAMLVLVVWMGERAVVSTLAGGVSGTNGAFANGVGTNAGFYNLCGVTVDASGNVTVADYLNHRVRKVAADASAGTKQKVYK